MLNALPNRIGPLLIGLPAAPGGALARRSTTGKNGNSNHQPATTNLKSLPDAPKRGILASALVPAVDADGTGRLVQDIRSELLAEFKPATFSQLAALDALAVDYSQLIRCQQMIAALTRPAPLGDQDAVRWARLVGARRDLRTLDRILGDGDHGLALPCTQREAGRLAWKVAEFVRQVRIDLTEWEDFEGKEAELKALDQEQLRELKELAAMIGADGRRFEDHGRVAVILRRQKRAGREQLRRLAAILSHLRDNERRWVSGQGDLLQRAQRLQDEALRAAADSPRQLILLDRYKGKIERSIERKLKHMRER